MVIAMRLLAQATFVFRYNRGEQVGIFELAIGASPKRPKPPEDAIPIRIQRADHRKPKKRQWFLRWTAGRFCFDPDRTLLPDQILEWAKNELKPRDIAALSAVMRPKSFIARMPPYHVAQTP
jgi:hypothetical protein